MNEEFAWPKQKNVVIPTVPDKLLKRLREAPVKIADAIGKGFRKLKEVKKK